MEPVFSEEQLRIETLKAYDVLDTEEAVEFDNLVKLAAQICEVPIAKLNFIDDKRAWSKANYGNDVKETPREYNFCHTTITQDEYMVVEDASKDDRFNQLEFVTEDPKIRFYAGVNIRKNQQNLGTICVLGLEPKQLSDSQLDALKVLASEVEARIELHKKTQEQKVTNAFLSTSVDVMMIINPKTLVVEEFNKNDPELFNELESMDSSKPVNELLPDWDFPSKLKESYKLNKESFKTESKLKLSGGDIYLEINAILRNDRWLLTAKNITKRRLAEQQIIKEQQFTESIINSLPVNFFMYDEDWNVIKRHTTETLKEGYTDEEFAALSPLDFFEGDDLKRIQENIKKAFSQDEPVASIEADLIRKDGVREPFLFNAISLEKNGKKYLIGTSQSIAKQRSYRDKLEKLLKEKEVLLSEVHHRVKNNLAVISGLLQMEGFLSKEDAVRSVLLSNQMRVKSMALVHEELYKAKNFSSIQFDHYLKNLLTFIKKERNDAEKNIQLKSDLESIELNLNQAVPLALIINELVSNAYIYAFEGREKGVITVNLFQKEGEIHMSVTDDGIGLPEGFVLEESPTLGTTLVLTYSNQINSEIKINSKKETGTKYELVFSESKNMKGSSASVIM
jgi:PAS domain S-box-containing protein